MNDKNLAFSAMLLSVTFFAIIGFISYYPIVQYLECDSQLSQIIHDFLIRFKPLQEPLPGRTMLLMFILGSVMLYNPRKKEGKSFLTGLSYCGIGCILLFITGYFKPSQISLLWCSLILYNIGFLFSVSGSVHLFQVMDFVNDAKDDPFNDRNETFRQMEERIDTEYSVNIPYEYQYQGQLRKGWINFVNLFRPC